MNENNDDKNGAENGRGTEREEIPFPAEKEEVEAVADDVERLRERMIVLDRLLNQAYEESDALDASLPFVMPENREDSGEGGGDT